MGMVKPSVDTFLDLLRRSGLVENDQLNAVLADVPDQAHGTTPGDIDVVAQKLVAGGLLTRWQCDKLLEGRHKGFFLGKYKLLDHLGTGGMSSVYLAEHVLMQRRVAIKVLPKNRVEDSSYLARFHREAQAAAALDHRNIVRAYDVDNDGSIHYLVMEYVEGRDLQQMVKEKGPLEYSAAAEYIRQAAEGLAHAHGAGLIHRDVKPANLLVDQKSVVKVLDLGLARFTDEDRASLTVAYDENVLGTADYLAPEQAINSHGVDTRADIYSLGCSLYFLLTGHPPFPEGTLPQRLMMHQKTPPPSIYKARPSAPQDLVSICVKMMAKKPEHRYQTAAEVAAALGQWLAAHGHTVGSESVPGGSSGLSSARLAAAGSAVRAGGLPPVRSSSRGAKPPLRHPGEIKHAPDIPPLPSGRPAPADTMTNRDRQTVKGPGSAAGRARGSGQSGVRIAPQKDLPVVKPLEPAPAQKAPASEFVIDFDDVSVPIHSPGFTPVSDERLRAYRARHKGAPPVWLWIGIGAGFLLAVIMAIVAIMSSQS